MARSTLSIWILSVILFLSGATGAQDGSQTEQPLQLEEATFEANGDPLYVLNARARVKNVGARGYRGSTVRFYCRLDSTQDWTLIGVRPLPGVRPGDSVTCDLVTSSEGLPIVDSEGEIGNCQYRFEIHYQDEVTVGEGEFHPACLHEH